jgi:hypothetical protein
MCTRQQLAKARSGCRTSSESTGLQRSEIGVLSHLRRRSILLAKAAELNRPTHPRAFSHAVLVLHACSARACRLAVACWKVNQPMLEARSFSAANDSPGFARDLSRRLTSAEPSFLPARHLPRYTRHRALTRSVHVRVETIVSYWKQMAGCPPNRYTLVMAHNAFFHVFDARILVSAARASRMRKP